LQLFFTSNSVVFVDRGRKNIFCLRAQGTLATPLIKEGQGEFQIYFRKIPLHQQNFLVVSVLSNSLGCRGIWKNVQNETTKLFSVGNTTINIQSIKANFVYEVLRNYPKINEFCFWNQQSRLKY